jgi:hypothetical protein
MNVAYSRTGAMRWAGGTLRYDVVLVGFRLNARLKPAQALQAVLGLDAEACKALTQKFPATVLTGVSQSRADKVVEQLDEVGGKAEIHLSRISLANEPEKDTHSVRPFGQEELSGNYAIGEILAPMPKHPSVRPKGEAAPTKRPSREELDQALRDSFRPADDAAAKDRSAEHDLAFAGLQNFDDSLGGLDRGSPALEVDEVAFRSIQRKPETNTGRMAVRKLTFEQRLVKFLRRMLSSSFDWSMGLLSLAVVAGVTLYAVGYALDPEHAIAVLKLEELPGTVRAASDKLLAK